MPGWYPDPAGAPGRFRYWDGTSWSAETTDNPASSRPMGFASTSGGVEQDKRDGGKGPLIALLAGLLVLALLVWAMFFRGGDEFKAVPEDTNSASPTGPVWNETSPPTPSKGISEPAPTGGAMVECPTGGGDVIPATGDLLHAGGLSAPKIDGWDYPPSFDLRAIHQVQLQLSLVKEGSAGTAWLSGQLVGTLLQSEGFREPATAAQQLMACFASSSYYPYFSSRDDLINEHTTIDGRNAWHLRSNIRINSPLLPDIPGDTMDVYVVDTGISDSFAVYCGWFTIGDTERQSQIEKAIASLAAS